MTSRTIQHRIAIDDRRTSSPSEEDSNYFVFNDGWTTSQSSSLYDLLWSTSTELTGSTPENSLEGVQTTVHFTGSGVLLRGQATCRPEESGQTLYFGTLDGDVAITRRVSSSDKVLFNTTDLRDASHTLDLRSVSPCANHPTGSPFKLSVDYALITLDPQSPITLASDMLLVESSDPFITYEGEWAASDEFFDEFGLEGMETSEIGASLVFTFYGSSIRVFAQNPNIWTISVKLDDDEPTEVDASRAPGRQIFEAERLESSGNAPHTLNITVTELPPQRDTKFRIEAFMYSPTFSSLSEADELFRRWEEEGGGGDPGDGGDPDPPPDDRIDDSTTPVGAIAGGVIGGVAVLLLLCGLLWWARRRKSARRSSEAEDATGTGQLSVRDPGFQPVPYTKSYRDEPFNADIVNHVHSPDASLTPYTKSYHPASSSSTRHDDSLSHTPNPAQSSSLTPYMKSYHQLSTPRDDTFAGASTSNADARSSSQVTPYTKSYHPTATSSSPVSSPSHPSSPSDLTPNRATSSSIPSTSSNYRPSLQVHTNSHAPPSPSSHHAASPLDTDPPPTFVSRNQDGQSEVGVGGTGSPTTTTRLMGIIDTMRQRMDAMEPPPAYATEIGSGASAGGGNGAGTSGR